jgi:CheY-like chemotaxis protein
MRKNIHIILADDDPDDCFIFSTMSQELGNVHTTCLNDCNSLLNFLQLNTPPDLIFLDLNMPILSGQDCLKRIKQHAQWKKIPVVIYSTASRKDIVEDCKNLGADLYIVKPSNSGNLKNAISLAIQQLTHQQPS